MSKLEILRKLPIIFLIIIMLFSLTGCDKNKSENDNNKKEKVNQEMSYLDSKIIAMLNRLNNISFSNYKVVSEDVKEETSGITNGNEKNASSQEKFMQDTESSSSNSEGGSDNEESENSEKGDNQENKDSKKGKNDSSNEKDSSSSSQSSDNSRKQSNF